MIGTIVGGVGVMTLASVQDVAVSVDISQRLENNWERRKRKIKKEVGFLGLRL